MRPEEEALAPFFAPDRIHAAAAILRCLFNGDSFSKEEFSGVKIEDVRDAARCLGLEIEAPKITASRK